MADAMICDHAVHLTKFGMMNMLLDYSTASSNKFKYINLYIICKDKAKHD